MNIENISTDQTKAWPFEEDKREQRIYNIFKKEISVLFFTNISYECILVHALKDISDFSTVRLNVVVVVLNVVVLV